jgi:predicted Zn-dependent protease
LEYQKTKIDIEPGRHKVTLSASAVADLMIYLMWTASARDAAQGRSVFSAANGGTRIGEQLTSRNFNLVSDPKLSGLETLDRVINLGASSMSSPFDTGLPISATSIISGGVLSALASSRHAASEAGLPFTPLADNIHVYDAAGHGSLAETAARMGEGLLITCLWYIREVDPQSLLLTGLTRDGVYVVRNGEIVGAASNFRFNDSPVSLLNRITDAGESLDCLPREWADWFSLSRVAPLTIDGFNLSTKSDAI